MTRLSIGVAVVVAVGAGNVAFAQSKCDSTITRAAGKKVACKAGVISKAQKSGGPPDAARLAKCEAKFAKTCGNGRAAGDCVVQTGSCAGIEGTVDTCVTTLSDSATTTTSTTTTTTTLPPGACEGGCGGTCPPGEFCTFTNVGNQFFCGCFATGATECGDSGFPQCGGACLGGQVCQATRRTVAGSGNPPTDGCGCVDPATVCPPGDTYGQCPPAFGTCASGFVCAALCSGPDPGHLVCLCRCETP